MVTNMLGKMRIRCIYDKNGCKGILLLDNLENHQKSCRFNKKICEKCFCDQSLNQGVGQFIDSQFIDSQFIDRPFYRHPV